MIHDLLIELVEEGEEEEICPECELDALMRGIYRDDRLLVYVIWCIPCGRKIDERLQNL